MARRLAWAGGAASALVLLFHFDPATAGFFPPCLFNQVTGLLCPGCGTTRAAHALLHGDLAGALRLNALAVVGLPLAAVWTALATFRRSRGRPLALPPAIPWLLAAAVLAFTVGRNV